MKDTVIIRLYRIEPLILQLSILICSYITYYDFSRLIMTPSPCIWCSIKINHLISGRVITELGIIYCPHFPIFLVTPEITSAIFTPHRKADRDVTVFFRLLVGDVIYCFCLQWILRLRSINIPFIHNLQTIAGILIQRANYNLVFSISQRGAIKARTITSYYTDFCIYLVIILRNSFYIQRKGTAQGKNDYTI